MSYSLDKNINILHHPDTVPISIQSSNSRIPFHEYLKEKCPSLFGPKANFTPSPYLRSGHLQTVYAAFYKGSSTFCDITYERQTIRFKDGGVASLDWVKPLASLPDNAPTVVILHGLTGGSHETYIRGFLQVICRPPINYRAVVYNARGCGFTQVETALLTNAANTDDIREALAFIQDRIGKETSMVGVGFSLGSNILVKYLGEQKEDTPLKAAISIGNPYDFIMCGHRLEGTFFRRTLYSKSMATNLKRIFFNNQDVILDGVSQIDISDVLAARTIREYDNACTKKMFRYTTVDNYYRDASCCRVIEHVRIPLLCINAIDDPISSRPCVPIDEIMINPYVVLAMTQFGGHLGWFEYAYRPSRWIDKPIIEFIVAMFQANDKYRPFLNTHHAAQYLSATRKPNPYNSQQLFKANNPLLVFFVLIFLALFSWK